jgi:hypothetical protein
LTSNPGTLFQFVFLFNHASDLTFLCSRPNLFFAKYKRYSIATFTHAPSKKIGSFFITLLLGLQILNLGVSLGELRFEVGHSLLQSLPLLLDLFGRQLLLGLGLLERDRRSLALIAAQVKSDKTICQKNPSNLLLHSFAGLHRHEGGLRIFTGKVLLDGGGRRACIRVGENVVLKQLRLARHLLKTKQKENTVKKKKKKKKHTKQKQAREPA